jgi:hypothetical protein
VMRGTGSREIGFFRSNAARGITPDMMSVFVSRASRGSKAAGCEIFAATMRGLGSHPRGDDRGVTTSQIRASGYPKSCAPSVLLGIGVAQVLTLPCDAPDELSGFAQHWRQNSQSGRKGTDQRKMTDPAISALKRWRRSRPPRM